jgi:hypothetical protein
MHGILYLKPQGKLSPGPRDASFPEMAGRAPGLPVPCLTILATTLFLPTSRKPSPWRSHIWNLLNETGLPDRLFNLVQFSTALHSVQPGGGREEERRNLTLSLSKRPSKEDLDFTPPLKMPFFERGGRKWGPRK